MDVGKFFIFTLTLFCVGFCAASLGFMFSATVSVFAIANLLIALCYVFMMVSDFFWWRVAQGASPCLRWNSLMFAPTHAHFGQLQSLFDSDLSKTSALHPLFQHLVRQVFSGLLVNLQTMLEWLVWIKWFSIFRYALNVSVRRPVHRVASACIVFDVQFTNCALYPRVIDQLFTSVMRLFRRWTSTS